MLEIDGTAGGQVLRTALGFSALLEREIKVSNIRAARPNPGLQHQHLTAVKTLQQLCSAELSGDFMGSTEITFNPKKFSGKRINVNIGTAGSTLLVVQSLLLPSISNETQARIFGGTDVPFAPTFSHTNKVLFPLLRKMNAKFEVKLFSHGYYPKGNGSIFFKSSKSRLPLKSLKLTEQGSIESISIFSQCSSLPREVSTKQAIAAKKVLSKFTGAEITEQITHNPAANSIGSSIDILCKTSNGTFLGVNALGSKGKPSEHVGLEAAEKFIEEIKSNVAVDSHTSDQLIPFMGLAKGKSEIAVASVTEHCKTCIDITEKFLGKRFEITARDGLSIISCDGVSWK